MAEKRVGIYIGSNVIGAAVVDGKNISMLTTLEFGAAEDTGAEIANEDIRWEAMVNKALQEAGSNVKKVYISLADKDFIFRSLEMPLMNRKEIETSIGYEIEKYIPFKIEELEWDFEFIRFAKERKISLSFIGIREANLRRIRDTFIRLGIDVEVIEPSSLALARAVKSMKRFTKLKDFAILDLTASESYLTFFQHDLPVFNRYLVMPNQDGSLNASRFNEAVDLSFQYFKREFKSYKLEQCIVIGDIGDANLIGTLKESLGTEVEAVGAYDIAKRNNATVANIKAFGAAARGYYPCVFAPVFKKSAAAAVSEGEKAPPRIPALKVWLHGTFLGVGLLGALFLSVFMGQEVMVQKAKIFKEEQNIQVPDELKTYSWQERETQTTKREGEVRQLKQMASAFQSLTPFFEKLSSRGIVPEGVWFERVDVREIEDKGKQVWRGVAEGFIYLDNPEAESQALDKLLANLKQDKTIANFFPNVELSNTRRVDKGGYNLTAFSINLGRR